MRKCSSCRQSFLDHDKRTRKCQRGKGGWFYRWLFDGFFIFEDASLMTRWWFQTFFIVHNIWDDPSHWLIFFKMVKTTNQFLRMHRYWVNHDITNREISCGFNKVTMFGFVSCHLRKLILRLKDIKNIWHIISHWIATRIGEWDSNFERMSHLLIACHPAPCWTTSGQILQCKKFQTSTAGWGMMRLCLKTVYKKVS